ncbi:MAG: hypothetical protein K2K37_04730, partial [Muribaculaceae bacterium]|nr:hypothetical protein [Muribaculaceae bacterium]
YDASKYTEKQRNDIAHYDNATLYLDTVLAKIFDAYSGTEAIVLYMPTTAKRSTISVISMAVRRNTLPEKPRNVCCTCQ